MDRITAANSEMVAVPTTKSAMANKLDVFGIGSMMESNPVRSSLDITEI